MFATHAAHQCLFMSRIMFSASWKMFCCFTHLTPPLLNQSLHHTEPFFHVCFSHLKPAGNRVQLADEQQALIQLALIIAVNKDWTTERGGGYPCPDTE